MANELMVITDKEGRGVAIIDGKTFAVTATWNSETWGTRIIRDDSRELSLKLHLRESLDEERQQRKITRLESQLVEERELLAEIRATVLGEKRDDDA